MNRLTIAFCLAFLCVVTAVPLAAQEDPPAAGGAAPDTDAVDQALEAADDVEEEYAGEEPQPEDDFDNIEDILEGNEEVLAGSGYTYDPGERRDPFRSLLRAPDRAEFRGPRPEGILGMLIDEVEVTGVYITSQGPVAQVQPSNKAISFLIRPGDQLFDGDVLDIRFEKGVFSEVVFKQILNDPTAVKPFREVVKKLNP